MHSTEQRRSRTLIPLHRLLTGLRRAPLSPDQQQRQPALVAIASESDKPAVQMSGKHLPLSKHLRIIRPGIGALALRSNAPRKPPTAPSPVEEGLSTPSHQQSSTSFNSAQRAIESRSIAAPQPPRAPRASAVVGRPSCRSSKCPESTKRNACTPLHSLQEAEQASRVFSGIAKRHG